MTRVCCWVMSVLLVLGVVGLSFVPAVAGGDKKKIKKNQEYDPVVEAANFVAGVDNPHWPLKPGTTFIYEDEDGEAHNEVRVTDQQKVITLPSGDTITCMVVRDLEWEDDGDEDGIWTGDELLEKTDDWYAQDVDGNVWYFGEYSESREDKDSPWVLEGSWEAYVGGALPGILMPANPQTGESYRQEYLEGEAEDMAQVLKLNASASVPWGDYEGCLKTKEWTPLEPGSVEHKYYAPGVGLVLIEELHGGKVRVELIGITTTPPTPE